MAEVNNNEGVENTQENQGTQAINEPKTYTIEELQQLDAIMSKRSEGVANSVAKSQTSSKEEADALLAAYKDYKKNESKKNETNLADITAQLEKANNTIKELKLNNAVIMEAQSSGLNDKTVALFMKSYDTTTAFDKDGNVDNAKIKENLDKFLDDFPGLRPTQQNNKPHVKVGAQAQDNNDVETIQDKINKAMGIKNK